MASEIKTNVERNLKFVLGAVSYIVAVNAILTAYDLWKKYGKKPKVSVIEADYNNGRAIIDVNGVQHKLLIGSPFYVGDYWSVQMKTDKINRIELLKQGNVKEYLTT
jgi:hypothetical protein